MSVIDPAVPRVLVNKITRWNWGPDRRRVVRLVVVTRDGVATAIVYGAHDGQVVELERSENVEVPRSRAPRIKLADGTVWEAKSVGCSCNVPGPLRTFRPTP